MRRVKVPPSQTVHVKYLSGTREDVVVRVHATGPIAFVVLDPENHELYVSDQSFQTVARVPARMDHEIGIRIPNRIHWYLSFENGTRYPVDVDFEVLDYAM